MIHGNTPDITEDCNTTLGQYRPLWSMVTPQALPRTLTAPLASYYLGLYVTPPLVSRDHYGP